MADTTQWAWEVDATTKKATLTVARSDIGGSPQPISLGGVCYSPAPLNGSNKFAPAIGDWYWDSFDGVTGWEALWNRDIPRIRQLQANAIRVYCMLSRQLNLDGTFPNPWNSGNPFTHQTFLDQCWDAGASPLERKPLYVLVGIPLPSGMFWKAQYNSMSQVEITYWTEMLQETAQLLGQHPAVMGFTISNEQDGSSVCYGDPDFATFWWGQVEKMAAIVKQAAPDKLVGMATHDDPNIPAKAAAYMAQCADVDYWAVNTYQTENFDSIFNGVPDNGVGYNGLTGTALKPVILAEYGFSATGRTNPNDASTIYEDQTTRTNVATVIAPMLPMAFQQPLCLGLYYFEFCDEWWNEPIAPNIYTWWGGDPDAGLPNGYWDQDGFGLYSIRRGGDLSNDAPIWVDNGPNTPIDVQTERTEITAKVSATYGAIVSHETPAIPAQRGPAVPA